MKASRAPLGMGIVVAVLAAHWIYFTLFSPDTPQTTFFPESDFARSSAKVYGFVNVLLLVIFILVEGALVWVLFRFRKEDTSPGDELPEQTHGKPAVEIGFTLATAVLVVVLFVPSCQQIQFAQGSPPPGALEIEVVGKQWWWEFYYEDFDLVVANELHVPAGRPVLLKVTASDVIHSFWVPRLGGKRDAVPGRHQPLWFTADRPGVYDGQCAEFCGSSHALMSMQVVVDSPEDFEKWLERQKAPPTQEVMQGIALFAAQGCMACHYPMANDGNARGLQGPNLRTLATRGMIASGLLPNTPENLTTWLRNPQHVKPSAKMNIMAPQCTGEGEPDPCCRDVAIGNCLSEDTIEQLVAYLQILR